VNGTGSGNHLLKFENGPAGVAELPFNTTGTDWQDISLDFGAGLNNYGRMNYLSIPLEQIGKTSL